MHCPEPHVEVCLNNWRFCLFHASIQGVSRLQGITAGGDFVGLCDQSLYKRVSDFGRLRSYDRLKLRVDGNDYCQ